MDCIQGLVGAGYGNEGVCAGRFSREEGAVGLEELSFPKRAGWGCPALPGGAGGHVPPSEALLPVTRLRGCKERTGTTASASQQCQWDWDFTGNYAREVKASKLSYSYPTALLALWLFKGGEKKGEKKGKEVKYSLLVRSLDITVNT